MLRPIAWGFQVVLIVATCFPHAVSGGGKTQCSSLLKAARQLPAGSDESEHAYAAILAQCDDPEMLARAMLERGVVLSLRPERHLEARAQLGKVLSDYPESEAANHAAYHIARIAFDDRDEPEVVRMLQLLLARYPDSTHRQSARMLARAALQRAQDDPAAAPSWLSSWAFEAALFAAVVVPAVLFARLQILGPAVGPTRRAVWGVYTLVVTLGIAAHVLGRIDQHRTHTELKSELTRIMITLEEE